MGIRSFNVFVVLVCAAWLAQSSALAADVLRAPSTGSQEGSLTGLSEQLVIDKLGKPDITEDVPSQNQKILHFGRSLVIFAQGRVIGWSDQGEIEERMLYHQVEKDDVTPSPENENKHWLNDWTPQPTPDPQQVIQDLEQDGDRK